MNISKIILFLIALYQPTLAMNYSMPMLMNRSFTNCASLASFQIHKTLPAWYHHTSDTKRCTQKNTACTTNPSLEKALITFKNTESALTHNGPMKRLLAVSSSGDNPCALKQLCGAAYELETAHKLKCNGSNIVGFCHILSFQNHCREFDIVTDFQLIECKHVNWHKLNAARMIQMKQIFLEQAVIAKHHHKQFEVHSKLPIPETLKSWFKEKNILYYQG